MKKCIQTLSGRSWVRKRKTLKLIGFLLCIFPGLAAFSQQVSKIQQTVNALKCAYYCEDQDYHTDGQRVVWVKSYKKWEPQDWPIIRKEAPHVVTFLSQAIQHNRYDILEQLLPDYYGSHGGVKAFAADIVKQRQTIASVKKLPE